jgi:lysophospholipid acyltransferase (LPLAT)-like uncharacterized protein
VPARLRIPFLVYGHVFGWLWYTYILLLRLTLKVRVTGAENVPNGSNFILCQWHETGPLAIETWAPRLPAYLRQRPHAWIVHSDWYTKPVWIVLSLVGVDQLVSASRGNGRRAAAEEIVSYLKKGYSTFVTPDGPKGPARSLKKGVLHMAEQSGVPILPVRISADRCYRTDSWDQKMQPLPFSTIHVDVGAPIEVTSSTFDESIEALATALG